MDTAEIIRRGKGELFNSSWRDRCEFGTTRRDYNFTLFANGVEKDVSLTNMFIAVSNQSLGLGPADPVECKASIGFRKLEKYSYRNEDKIKNGNSYIRMVYFFCNNFPKINFPVKQADGSVGYITSDKYFSKFIFGDMLDRLEEDYGILYAQSDALSSDSSEPKMARIFYLVSPDGSPEAIKVIDEKTEKLADYLEASLDLIRDDLQIQLEEQKRKEAQKMSWREVFR
jgi:hypothetical protein